MSTVNNSMRFLSICSGIEAASVAASTLNWQCAAVSEIDPFCKRLLRHHYPEVPNLGDFTRIRQRSPLSRFVSSCGADLLCAGTPCQDFSVVGRRGGILDARGNLTLELVALLHELQRKRPRWFVWENVPGVLSSWSDVSQETAGPSDGWEQSDFDLFLSLLEECGYGIAYRVLDAQFFGVPQRRRRVFVVGYLGDWRRAAAVLFDRGSVQGDFTAGGKAGEDVAGCFTPGAHPGSYNGQDARNGLLIEHSLRADGFDASEDGTGRGTPLVPVAFSCKDHGADAGDIAPTLRGMTHDKSHANAGGQVAIAFDTTQITSAKNYNHPKSGDPCHPLASGAHAPAISQTSGVRRLTPRECERLMGFPDDYTLIPTYLKRQKETGADALALYAYYCRTSRGQAFTQFRDGRVYVTPDGPRYKALGNSWAVPCVRWIFSCIDEVDKL